MEQTYDYTVYDGTFFTASEVLLQKKRKHTSTPENTPCYVVKRIYRIDERGEVSILLVCIDKLHLSGIYIKLHALELNKLSGKHATSKTKEVLPTWLNEKEKIEVTLHYSENNLLGSLRANSQIVGNMLLEQGLAQPYYGKGRRPSWCE